MEKTGSRSDRDEGLPNKKIFNEIKVSKKIRGPCGRGFLEGVLAGMPDEVDEETLRVRFEGDWRSR
jgi:hypothetical protein